MLLPESCGVVGKLKRNFKNCMYIKDSCFLYMFKQLKITYASPDTTEQILKTNEKQRSNIRIKKSLYESMHFSDKGIKTVHFATHKTLQYTEKY